MASITLKGIDQGISDLNFKNKDTLQYRLVNKIRGYYENEDSIEHIKDIDRDELVKALWNIGDDPEEIKSKRKNLSSIKSSVNSRLKKLFKNGKNPEGVIIGPDNVFVMSDEAKDKALDVFKDSMEMDGLGSLNQIAGILKVVKKILSNPDAIEDTKNGGLSNLDMLKGQIQELSEVMGLGDLLDVAEPVEDLDEEEVIEEFDDVEEDDTVEEVEVEEDLEQIEIDDDVEEVDEDLEEIEIEEGLEEDEVEEGLEEDEIEEELEEVEVEEELEEVEIEEELEEVEEIEESDLPEEDLGEEDEIEEARLLAEEFDNSLAAADKYYNQYIIIQEGEYIAGSKQPGKNEKPEQAVQLSSYFIGKFPVTNALFENYVEKTGYLTTAEKLGYSTVYYGRSQKTIDRETGLKTLIWNSAIINKTVEGACWYQPFGPGSTLHNRKSHPVVHVTLEDVIAFAAWSGKRLPTEDEWEAASRTANGYVFPWGNDWKKDSCNIEESSIGDTAPVDKYIELANDFEIADTIGNVLEWTSDVFEPPSYVKGNEKYYIVKGGSWISENNVKLFSRFSLEPESHSNILGFRCVAY